MKLRHTKSVRNKKVKYGSHELDRDFGPLTFGKLLESHRLTEEISQAALAKILKISRQKLNDFEHGRRFPSLRVVADIARRLDEHEATWISIVIEEMLRRDNLKFRVTLSMIAN